MLEMSPVPGSSLEKPKALAMNLEFSDITVQVSKGWKDKGEGRIILHGVNGAFKAGHLTAIMGPSGAGKSTLLDVISGYRSLGAKGAIKVNGKPIDRRLFHKYSRYITQEDLLPPLLTAGEAMHIAASLKLPSSTTKAERDAVVEENLLLLRLQNSFDTPTSNLSGGQKKRLSIALELINNPYLFFLDEPTSGLDNVSTKQTLKLLSRLAKGGRTIVCTIHQPSATLFDMFDSVYVLGRGRCVYQGSQQNLLPFLSSAGFRCPTYHNPADHVIEVVDASDDNISVLSKAMENGRISHSSSKEEINVLDYTYDSTVEQAGHISRHSSSDNSEDFLCEIAYKNLSNATVGILTNSFWHEFCVLYKRMTLQIWRNKWALKVQFLHHVGCGLLVALVFYNAGMDAVQYFSQIKFCVGYILFHTYTYIMLPVLTFPTEIKNVKKEHFNRWYRVPSYYLANMLTKMPTMFVFGVIFSAMMYFFAGLPAQLFRFSQFALIGFITALTADSLGIAIGSIFNVTNSSAVGPAVVAPFLGLSVYGLDFARDLSWPVRGILRMSFMRCGVVAVIITMFGYDREMMKCDDVYCHFENPKKVLQFTNLEDKSVWSEIGNMVLLLAVFRIISYVALKYRLSFKG